MLTLAISSRTLFDLHEAHQVYLTKGIEADSYKLMSEVLAEELPGFPLGVMSGPNLAKEIADGAMGKYHQIAKADGNAIASVTNQALNELKTS